MHKLPLFVLGFVLVSTGVFAHEGHAHKPKIVVPKNHADLAPLSSLPDFSLTDQNGNPVSLPTLKGKAWVADFIYTSCADECPLMTSRMKSLQTKLAAIPVAFVSITTDPKNDSTKTLKAYARTHQVNEANWWFLTGEKKEIIKLSVEGFKLPAKEKSRDHTEHFVLVDAAGQIRGYYDSTNSKALESLERDVRTLSTTK